MAGYKGRAVQFTWDGVEIPGVREKGIQASGERVDITSDDDDGWRRLADNGAAQNNVDVSLAGVIKNNILKQAWYGQDRIKQAEFTFPDGSTLSGEFHLVSYNEANPYNDAATFEASIQSSGPVVFTPAS